MGEGVDAHKGVEDAGSGSEEHPTDEEEVILVVVVEDVQEESWGTVWNGSEEMQELLLGLKPGDEVVMMKK